MANSDPKEYGDAVYLAQAILDTVIRYPIDYGTEYRIQHNSKSDITLYPNPANTHFYLQDSSRMNAFYTIYIYDNYGIYIHKLDNIQNNMPVNIKTLSSGYYLVKAISDFGTVSTFKLIKSY